MGRDCHPSGLSDLLPIRVECTQNRSNPELNLTP
jgi:hypothetical protein